MRSKVSTMHILGYKLYRALLNANFRFRSRKIIFFVNLLLYFVINYLIHYRAYFMDKLSLLYWIEYKLINLYKKYTFNSEP